MRKILEGSQAISHTINLIKPAVISAYPITPQTHIVEDLARLKADGEADFEYVRAESEFAAASIVAGASAAGARVYTATSSQGLLLMAEVLFNIAGMRLPVVLTCANRGVSAPITIWNDHQDAMTVRDSGWIMLFAENHQEAIEQHIIAYKIAEKMKLPAMVNIDGFVLTHTYEPVTLPTRAEVRKFLGEYKPKLGEYLDPAKPATMGAFAAPAYYLEIRQDLHNDLLACQDEINLAYDQYREQMPDSSKPDEPAARLNTGLVEYYGEPNPATIIVAMGSLVGTIKDTVDEIKGVGVLKIKTFRPFPEEEILHALKKTKHIAVMEKAITLGASGPLAADIRAVAQGRIKANIGSYIVGLGGRDITKEMVKKIVKDAKTGGYGAKFIG